MRNCKIVVFFNFIILLYTIQEKNTFYTGKAIKIAKKIARTVKKKQKRQKLPGNNRELPENNRTGGYIGTARMHGLILREASLNPLVSFEYRKITIEDLKKEHFQLKKLFSHHNIKSPNLTKSNIIWKNN